MITNLLNQLRLCSVIGSLHTLFANPPTTFHLFCANLLKTETGKRKTYEDFDSGKPQHKKEKKLYNQHDRKEVALPTRHDGKVLLRFS